MNTSQEFNILESIVLFLQKFSWLHNFPMIRIFSLNVIEELPEEWKTWFEDGKCNLYMLSSLPCKDISCSSLKYFIEKCEEYSLSSLLQSNFKGLSYESVEDALTILEKNNHSPTLPATPNSNSYSDIKPHNETSSIDHPWKIIVQANEKKKHEVEELSKFVWKMKQFTKTDQIFDIGSGLGYLGLYLHLVYGFKIIGAEGSPSNVKSSLKLKDHCLKTTCPAVKFIIWNLNDDNETIEKTKVITESSLPKCHCSCNSDSTIPVIEQTNSSVTSPAYNLVSLHSCADLSSIMLKIFVNNDRLSSIVLLSCCYHKMTPHQEINEKGDEFPFNIKTHYKFKNIPLSRTLSDVLSKTSFDFSTFSLRLAAEESLCQWRNRTRDKLEEDLTSIAYRAILQTVCEHNNLQLKKRRRHCGKKTSYKNFAEYVAIIFQDYSFLTSSGNPYSDVEYLSSKLNVFYLRVKGNLKYISLIRVLQLHLQPVLEAVILLDRVLYLKENGFSHSGIVELFDSSVSPRSKAIVAFR